MKRLAMTLLALVLLATLVSVLGPALLVRGEPAGNGGSASAASDEPLRLSDEPLRLSDEPPRLSDEPPLLLGDDPSTPGPGPEAADNSRCHVCHLNFALEELAVVHARANIGCDDCHGDCDEHIADESWASGGPGTPPEIMFPPERIDPACRKCHHGHDAPAADVIGRWRERCPEKTRPDEIVCTDCHGRHRLKPELRKAWWDKRTGKPIDSPHEKRARAQ